MARSETAWRFAVGVIWLTLRPPTRRQLTARAFLRRAAWRAALPVALVPVGLALAAVFERYPDHPVVRAIKAVAQRGEPAPAGDAPGDDSAGRRR